MAVDVDTGAERVIYRVPSWALGSGYAAFAPDGKRILFGALVPVWRLMPSQLALAKKHNPGHDPSRRARPAAAAAEHGRRQRHMVARWQTDRIPLPVYHEPDTVVQALHIQAPRHQLQALPLARGVR